MQARVAKKHHPPKGVDIAVPGGLLLRRLAAAALATASETARTAFPPRVVLFGVPSNSNIRLSMSIWW
jgi:hypothetical protein